MSTACCTSCLNNMKVYKEDNLSTVICCVCYDAKYPGADTTEKWGTVTEKERKAQTDTSV